MIATLRQFKNAINVYVCTAKRNSGTFVINALGSTLMLMAMVSLLPTLPKNDRSDIHMAEHIVSVVVIESA